MASGVTTLTPDKDAIRRHAWQVLQELGVALFPGAWGRIPNFRGAEEAARRATELHAWQAARVIKCNPDSPQLPLRRLALEQGKTVYMAVPRLTKLQCFVELDPRMLRIEPRIAASIKGAMEFGRLVHPAEMPNIDLIVTGSVAVSAEGSRVGKGGGFSDLEYALLAELGRVDDLTTVITTVHPAQIVVAPLPMHDHDIPLDVIVTPEQIIPCPRLHPAPAGIAWNLLSRERIAEMPVVAELWRKASRWDPEALPA